MRSSRSETLRVIKEHVLEGAYHYTGHARLEMRADQLTQAEVRYSILCGRLVRILSRDPRGRRYVIFGRTTEGREVEVVCRMVLDQVRIITVYAIE